MRSDKREIILVFGYYGVGGAQRRATNLANEWFELGYKVSVVALLGFTGNIEESFYGLREGIRICSIPDYYNEFLETRRGRVYERVALQRIKFLKGIQHRVRANSQTADLIKNRMRCVKEGRALKSFLSNCKEATIICFGFNIYERCYYAVRGTSCKLIYAETNAKNKYINDTNYSATLNAIKHANAWVFQTREEKNQFEFGKLRNAEVIYNPIMEGLPTPYMGDRKKAIVNFCAFKNHKNLELLVDAFGLLHTQYPEYVLHIFGSSGDESAGVNPYEKKVRERINNNKLNECVSIFPANKKVHEIIRDYAMFVSSSDYEGLSNSMLEAMAIGLPCVCTDCDGGGAREIIMNEENGLLVEKNNKEALFLAMKRFINEPELANKCARNAAKIRDELTVDKIAAQWIKIIENT